MIEVQVTCPQYHQTYGELIPDGNNTVTEPIKQCCPHCGYPDVVYNVKYPCPT